MKDAEGNGLVYAGDVAKISTYDMYLDDRIVFRVTVDNDDPLRTINVVSVDYGTVLHTKGRAGMLLTSRKTGPGEADVEVYERIESLTVQSYVYPRLTRLLADLYVPRQHAEATS